MAATYERLLAEYLRIPPQDRKEGSEIDRALKTLEEKRVDMYLGQYRYRKPGLLPPKDPSDPKEMIPKGCWSYYEAFGPEFSDAEILARINDPKASNNRVHSDKFTLDQDGRGSCAAEGMTGSIMCVRDEMSLPLIKLNPWPLYYLSSGGRDAGSSLQANIQYATSVGIPSQAVIPREGSFRTMNETEKADALRHRLVATIRAENLQQAKSLLCMDKFMYLGYSGHAWFGVECLDLLRLLWKNSWGADWGDNGHSTLSWSSVMQGYGMYAPVEIFVPDDEVDVPAPNW